jgi:hypothetical protein
MTKTIYMLYIIFMLNCYLCNFSHNFEIHIIEINPKREQIPNIIIIISIYY